MAYLTGVGDQEAFIQGDIAHLRQVFLYYQKFLDRMDALIYPVLSQETAQARWSQVKFSDKETRSQDQSQFISRVIYQMVRSFISRMVRSPIIIDLARMAADDAEAQGQHVVEDHLQGVLNYLNDLANDEERDLNHTSLMAMYAGRYGKIIQAPRVEKIGSEWCYGWDFYHPRNVYHDFGSYPRRAVHEFWNGRAQIEQKLFDTTGKQLPPGVQGTDNKALLRYSELWVEEKTPKGVKISRFVLVGDEVVDIREGKASGYERMPFQIITDKGVGAKFQAITQSVQHSTDVRMPFQGIEDHARPFYDSLEDAVRIRDDIASMELQALALGVDPTIHIQAQGGDAGALEGQRLGPGVTVITDIERQVKIEAIQLASRVLSDFTTPQLIQAEIDHVWPAVNWGATSGANESGILYNQRIDQAKNAIVAPALLVAIAYRRGFAEILKQEVEQDVSIALPAIRTAGRSQGHLQLIDFKARRDIPRSYGLRVTVPPMLAEDELKTVQIYQLAVTSGGYDEQLAMSTILRHQDAIGVLNRRQMDKMRNSPEALQIAQVFRAHEEARALEADAAREPDPAKRAVKIRAAIWAKMQAKAMDAKLTGAGQAFQQQPEPQGIAPAQQPPEALGGLNPSVQRMTAGVGAPGGRPPTNIPGPGGAVVEGP